MAVRSHICKILSWQQLGSCLIKYEFGYYSLTKLTQKTSHHSLTDGETPEPSSHIGAQSSLNRHPSHELPV